MLLAAKMETSEAEFGRMEPESQATKVPPLWAKGQGCEIRFGAMEKMQSFGQIWSHYSVTIGGRAARRPGGTE